MSELPQLPPKIVVEVATPEVVQRLEKDNEQLRHELKQLRAQHEQLHRTVYRLMDIVAEFRRQGK